MQEFKNIYTEDIDVEDVTEESAVETSVNLQQSLTSGQLLRKKYTIS